MNRSELDKLSREDLYRIIFSHVKSMNEYEEELAAAETTIEELQSKLKKSYQENEKQEREGLRQAARFRRPKEKKEKSPKSPGNKKGHKGHCRTNEKPIDEKHDVSLTDCPHCDGSDFTDVTEIKQIIEEIVRDTRVVELTTYRGKCQCCGAQVQSDHPLKTNNAQGAAGTQLGPKAKALAAELHYKFGISLRKTSEILKRVYGLSISPSGITNIAHTASERLEGHYEEKKQEIRNSSAAYADETSWYVGRPNYWLWVFTNSKTTIYLVKDSRAREVVYSILGKHYEGVLVSDCLAVYNDVNEKQQKCYAHHLKAISYAQDQVKQKEDLEMLEQIRLLLTSAIAIKKVKSDIPPKRYQYAIDYMQKKAKAFLPSVHTIEESVKEGKMEYEEPTLQVLKRLSRQRDHLFTFLKHEHVDATNNLAERRLRPAVIARKISCGNRTEKGAHTWEVLVSLMQTLTQNGESFVELLTNSYKEHLHNSLTNN